MKTLTEILGAQRAWEQQYLIERYGKQLCMQIYNDPRDVSHKYYREIFDGFDWSKDESKKAETSGTANNNSTVRYY